MLHVHQIAVPDLITTDRIFASGEIVIDGTLDRVRLNSEAACVHNATFDLKINGVSIYPTTPDKPVITNGTNSVDQDTTSFAVAVVAGDIFEWSLVFSTALSSVGQKLFASIYVEDGVSGGGGGGGSGTIFEIDKPPTSAHAANDEFNGSGLSGWTTYGGSDLTAVVGNGKLTLERVSNSNGLSGIYKAFPSGDWDMITKATIPIYGITAGNISVSLALFQDASSTSNPLVTATLLASSSTYNFPGLYSFTNRTTFGSTLIAADTMALDKFALPLTTVYLRLNKVGTTYSVYLSLDGVSWFLEGTGQDISGLFTPTHIGLLVNNTSGVTKKCFIDWFRVYTLLPDYLGGLV